MSPYGALPRRVLLVEDNPGDAELIRELLGVSGGRQLEVVSTLGAAAAALAVGDVDAVMIDLGLPDGSGVECVEFVRARARDLPIVVLTGTDDERIALRCIEAGGQDYLCKNDLRAQPLRRALAYACARTRELKARRQVDILRERHAAIVEASSDAIVSSDVDGIITSWNGGAEQIFGYARDEAVGRHFSDVMRAVNAEQTQRQHDRMARAREVGNNMGQEDVVRLHKDGSEVTLSVVTCDVRDDAGRVVGFAAIMRDVTESRRQAEAMRRQNEELAARTEQMRALTSRLNAVREEERTRLSRAVHDELGQLLTGVKMDLRWLSRRLAADVATPASTLLARLAEAEKLADHTVETVRRLALELRPSALDILGLPEAVRDEVRRFEARTGIAADVVILGDPRPQGEAATALFRIMQELLTNIIRHARASHVRVELAETLDEWVLCVEDDGVGMAEATCGNSTSLGLLGIRERTELLSGTFQIDGRPGIGTTARASVPRPCEPGGRA